MIARKARVVLIISVLIFAGAAAYGVGVFSSLQQGGFDTPGGETDQQMATEREIFGNHAADVIVIYSHDEWTTDHSAFKSAVAEIVHRLPEASVSETLPYYLTPDSAGLVSKDRHAGQLVISLKAEKQGEYLDAYDRIEPLLDSDDLETAITGYYPIYSDIHHQTTEDLTKAELISMPLVLVLALLIFGSAVAASMPAMIGVIAMVGSLAMVRLLANVTDVSIFVVNVVSLLGIGLAIDYALFIVSRFREELAAIPEGDADAITRAVHTTMVTAGRTVLFSGLTVAASMSTLLMFPQMFFRSMAYGGVAAVLIAMLASLTVLPAVLALLGRRVDAGKLPWRRHRPVAGLDDSGRWAALCRFVMRRPVAVLVLSAILMGVLATPFLGVKWGSFDHTSLPEDAPSRIAADELTGFGASSSPAIVLLTDTDESAVEEYLAQVNGLREDVSAFVRASDGDDYLVHIRWQGTSQEQSSLEFVRELRTIDPPRGEVLVGGLTADAIDLIDSTSDRLPWMALMVAGVMLVILFVAFGSIVMPIKAMMMNLFSLGACFGVVTWIFTDGHLSGVLAFEPQSFLDVTNSVLMLVIVFGLSMDYEVFVLSRVREAWDATGDAVASVAVGMQQTGRIISCAALLLGAVIGAFSTGGVIVLKMLGVGMLVALILDATVVRALMVPATMRLLGRWNWWAPGPLGRFWRPPHHQSVVTASHERGGGTDPVPTA